jgi:hypothetical protein
MTASNPIPHDIMIQSFFWTGTPREVAAFLAHWYRRPVSAANLLDAWAEEAAWNPLLREDRPPSGFEQTDDVKILQQIVKQSAGLPANTQGVEHACA